MRTKEHTYEVQTCWKGNTGAGTSSYTGYKRDHEISVTGKPIIPGSSDPSFRGDRSRYNPEELLVAALSACHMLWYLHLSAEAGVVVRDYEDRALGTMIELENGGGHFTEVILKPIVKVDPGTDLDLCNHLHERAHQLCFIATSVNFPVTCEAEIRTV